MSFASALIGTLLGSLLVMMGLARVMLSTDSTGLIAGVLMGLAGLLVAPHGRLALEGLFGPISREEAAGAVLLSLAGAVVLNVLFA